MFQSQVPCKAEPFIVDNLEAFVKQGARYPQRLLILAQLIRRYRGEGRFARAERLGNRALAVVELADFLNDLSSCSVLIEVGRLYCDVENYHRAEDLFDRAKNIAESSRAGGASEIQATALCGLGILARKRGDYSTARELLNTSLKLSETIFSPDSIEVSRTLSELGMVCKYAGWFADGLEYYIRALRVIKNLQGPKAANVAGIYHNLGGLEFARGEYREAERYTRMALEIRERIHGSDHVALALGRAAYGSILYGLGRLEEAEACLRAAIVFFENAFGHTHHEVAVNLNNLAKVVERRGDLKEAEALYRRALRIKEKIHGGNHPSVGNTLNNLGMVVSAEGRPGEAQKFIQRALVVLGSTVGADHPSYRVANRNYELMQSIGVPQEMPPNDAEAGSMAGNTWVVGLDRTSAGKEDHDH